MRHYLLVFLICVFSNLGAQNSRPRDLGISFGILSTGKSNSITDVDGVHVGHTTLVRGDSVRTGVTAILPHKGNLYQDKVPAAIYIANGYGKLAGYSQVRELGNIETPIILTNTLSVGTAVDAVVKYMIGLPGNENVRSVNAVVGETNDGRLNDIRGQHVTATDVISAIEIAGTTTTEGNVGAGTGTICFGFKGGIGTASRKLPESMGGYTVGVLVQTNFGGVLEIGGVPVGQELGKYYLKDELESADGSIMIVVATDAPILSRNLERLAKRAILGLAKTGGIASNGSGDYVIAFSTAEEVRITSSDELHDFKVLANSQMSPLFMATIEATQEAIINSLFAATTMTSRGMTVEELPEKQVLDILERYKKK